MFIRLLRKNYQQFSSQYLKKVQKLFQEGKYEQIFEVSPHNVTKTQLKERYNNLLKKYHADYNQNDKENAQTFEEISRIVIQSYRKISNKHSNISNESIKVETQIEDQISMRLFNKKYSEIKYWIYEKGNQQSKKSFLTQLYQKTGRQYKENKDETIKKNQENQRKNPFYSKQQKNTSQENDISGSLAVAGVISLVGLFIYSSFRDYEVKQKSQQQKNKMNSDQQRSKYSQENITKIKNKKEKERKQKAEIMINSILKDHPLSLKFPDEEPHIMKQLTQFSIASDIHLYQVSPECFKGTKKTNIIQNGFDKIKEHTYELAKIKPNTTMTLSLQAERALQNIYVKVTDVINQIKKNGKFTPPQVFIRFHGYIMCEIRQKPLTLTNYKDTDYISLFDLFFDYYSPIFLKRDQYTQYLVCKDEIQYFGWVHLNNKKCESVYLKPGQKAAYFHSHRDEANDQLYKKIWNDYYKYYYIEWNEKNNKNISNNKP